MTDLATRTSLSDWLMKNFFPMDRPAITAWKARVRKELGSEAVKPLLDLVLHGNDEEQYQAVQAARALGVAITADGPEHTSWRVRLPGQTRIKHLHP